MMTSDSLRKVVRDEDLRFDEVDDSLDDFLETDLDRNFAATELRKLRFCWLFPATATTLAATPVDCARPSIDVLPCRT